MEQLTELLADKISKTKIAMVERRSETAPSRPAWQDSGRPRRNTSPPIRCHYCDRVGHIMRDCRTRMSAERQARHTVAQQLGYSRPQDYYSAP